MTGKSGITKAVINGLDEFVASFPVPEIKWTVLASLPVNEFARGLEQLKKTIILLSAILFLAGLVLAFFLFPARSQNRSGG